MDADLEGSSSHGVMLVDMYLDRIRKGSVSTEAGGGVVSDKGTTVVLDAHHALGHLTGDQAIKIAVERARRFGAGWSRCVTAFISGRRGVLRSKAANADCIGIVMCNTRPLMPAPGGAERVVGNNPIAIAVPSDGPMPDRARHGDERSRDGQDPHGGEGRAEDSPAPGRSRPTAARRPIPAEAIAGMLLPASGPKGFGLAFLIDLLCGVLSGGATGERGATAVWQCVDVPYDSSHLFIAIDVAHFGDRATDARGRDGCSGSHPRRRACARRRAAVHARRAGMGHRRKRGGAGHADAGAWSRRLTAAGEGIAGAGRRLAPDDEEYERT